MQPSVFSASTKVMANGQITIPKSILEVLGVSYGDSITFLVEGNTVRIVNSAVYAMQLLQAEMAGVAGSAGIMSDDDVVAIVKDLRSEK